MQTAFTSPLPSGLLKENQGAVALALILLTWGWSVGREFGAVLLHLKDGRLATTGKIVLPEVFLIGLPKDQEILLKAFFATEDMGVSVEGLIYKAWNTPGLSKEWQRLKTCNLLKSWRSTAQTHQISSKQRCRK